MIQSVRSKRGGKIHKTRDAKARPVKTLCGREIDDATTSLMLEDMVLNTECERCHALAARGS